MKKDFVFVLTGAALLISFPVFADMMSEAATARAEAILALQSDDRDVMNKHLGRAVNCLVGRESGYFYAAMGDPCRGRGAIPQLTGGPVQKKRLDSAYSMLISGQAQSTIADAHYRIEDGIKMLDSALSTNE